MQRSAEQWKFRPLLASSILSVVPAPCDLSSEVVQVKFGLPRLVSRRGTFKWC